ncbi:hypothetical protein ICN19_08300 [Polynucleobacter sp. AP-Capit-er-40B-B4]|uniref:hypothetical protein n=1 Tax=Polynucleobacter sp. AP-Capit-er-40B-B4 TaxID=2576927 RepID=UPI001C0B1464|nr:hypothetical protein [Polynucleobacter sp. AP-Capit-er-40B-B4]MBU3582016.1 hypothetical protein [Polynucleobacter sp. AP-Capit-er-40B-B4]
MGKINIKFGYPTSQKEFEQLSERAIFHDESIESALCYEFEKTLNSLIKGQDSENFFDLVFFVVSGQKVTAPKVRFSSYVENGHRLPMIEFRDDYLMSIGANRINLSDELVDGLGELYQTEFNYEYAGFERVGA